MVSKQASAEYIHIYIYSCIDVMFSIADLNKENEQATAENVFGRENLSDCGMPSKILESLCRLGPDSVRCLERMCYNKDSGGYTWT